MTLEILQPGSTVIDERVMLTPEQAKSVIASGEYIHTFRAGPGTMFGFDWNRADILDAIDDHPAELAGDVATRFGHGIVINDGGFLFIATDEDRLDQLILDLSSPTNGDARP